jgi:single-strand DNA-binding protein
MSSLNKAQIIGRTGRDVEYKTLPNGGKVASFSLAASEKWKDKTTGETKEKTEWINCVAWGNLADILAKYVHKGDLIYVEGKITTRSYEKDGSTRYVTEILVSNMVMLGSKSTQSSPAHGEAAWDPDEKKPVSGGQPVTNNGGSDDLPF